MKTSDQINELATALAKAQKQIKPAIANAWNPHFKSNYADLTSVWEACREALASNNLSVSQTAGKDESGKYTLETRLIHSSGQWIESVMPLLMTKQDSQGFGSAWTYARRFALAAIVGVAPEEEDDDANEATKNSKHSGQRGTALTETKVQGASATSSVPPRPLTGPALPPGSSAPTPSDKYIDDFQAFLKRQGWSNRDAVVLIKRTYGKLSPRALKLSELDQIAEIIKATPINKSMLDEPPPPAEEWNPPLDDLEGGAPR
ncbi:MAG: hypothetical protein E6Q97_32915 [Desulfurellales bacterium]|nr:MAG: hypothetical protein E6Q97_32915 [Desulfurellales bacterium]